LTSEAEGTGLGTLPAHPLLGAGRKKNPDREAFFLDPKRGEGECCEGSIVLRQRPIALRRANRLAQAGQLSPVRPQRCTLPMAELTFSLANLPSEDQMPPLCARCGRAASGTRRVRLKVHNPYSGPDLITSLAGVSDD